MTVDTFTYAIDIRSQDYDMFDIAHIDCNQYVQPASFFMIVIIISRK